PRRAARRRKSNVDRGDDFHARRQRIADACECQGIPVRIRQCDVEAAVVVDLDRVGHDRLGGEWVTEGADKEKCNNKKCADLRKPATTLRVHGTPCIGRRRKLVASREISSADLALARRAGRRMNKLMCDAQEMLLATNYARKWTVRIL